MLYNLSLLFLALVYFSILARGADLLLGNLRAVADRTRIHPVLLGTILGFLTTVPEFMVGLNALHQDLPAISLGNIWGGMIVIFGLILGASIMLQREIKTDGRLAVVLPSFIFIISSLLLALKGSLNYYDGIFLLVFYILLVYLDYLSGGGYQDPDPAAEAAVVVKDRGLRHAWDRALYWRQELRKELWWSMIGLFLVVIASYAAMSLADVALARFSIPPLLVGLLVFSIGTNLPEITVMLRSLRNKSGDLSFGHLVGSGVSNILVLAILVMIKTIDIAPTMRFYSLIIFVILTLSAVSLFYVTKRRFNRWEGAVLFLIYIIFFIYQVN